MYDHITSNCQTSWRDDIFLAGFFWWQHENRECEQKIGAGSVNMFDENILSNYQVFHPSVCSLVWDAFSDHFSLCLHVFGCIHCKKVPFLYSIQSKRAFQHLLYSLHYYYQYYYFTQGTTEKESSGE